MTATATISDAPARRALPVPLASVAVALCLFAVMQIAAAGKAGWVFEYPLDDPYIHLAMAEQIGQGGYGVNAGQMASAASSALWPLLLVPAAGAEWGRYLPLVYNGLALAALAYLFARVVIDSGFAARWPRTGLFAALALPSLLNAGGLAFTGMEHTAHAAASVAIILGLVRLARGQSWGFYLALGCLLAPAFRLEGLALALLGAGAVVLSGQIARGLGLVVLACAPVVAFTGFLGAQGIGPLPASIMAKMLDGGVAQASWGARLIGGLAANITQPAGMALLALVALASIAAVATSGAARRIALVGAGAGAAHLIFGQVGWLNRYEGYALITVAASLLAACGLNRGMARALPTLAGLTGAVALLLGAFYASDFARVGYWAPRGIHLQQAQMARFVHDFAQLPVAVNDLGRVAWRNPDPVLDLWGLASPQAREARIVTQTQGWAGDLVAAQEVSLVMLYPQHFNGALGADWITLGDLQLQYPRGFLGGGSVRFYAATPQAEAPLRAALDAFTPSLPQGVRFVPTEAGQ